MGVFESLGRHEGEVPAAEAGVEVGGDGEVEVGDFGDAFAGAEDVGGFDIAVDVSGGVEGLEAAGDGDHEAGAVSRGEGEGEVGEVAAVDELLDDIGGSVLVASVVDDSDDIVVDDASSDEGLGSGLGGGASDFDGDLGGDIWS